jgi:hypothetical protein
MMPNLQSALDDLEKAIEKGTKAWKGVDSTKWVEELRGEPIAWMCEANDWGTWKPTLVWSKSDDKCFKNWKPLYRCPDE